MTNLGSLLLKTGHVGEARAQYRPGEDRRSRWRAKDDLEGLQPLSEQAAGLRPRRT